MSVSYEPVDLWKVAPVGFSGRACPACHKYFTDSEISSLADSVIGNISCNECGFLSTPESSSVSVRHEDRALLDDKTVFDRTWYHATNSKNWYRNIINSREVPLVHLGNLDAAISRQSHISNYLTNGSWFIFELGIKPTAKISPFVLDDHNDDAPRNGLKNKKFMTMGYQLNGVTRYVNRYESEGCISILANPASLELISVTRR